MRLETSNLRGQCYCAVLYQGSFLSFLEGWIVSFSAQILHPVAPCGQRVPPSDVFTPIGGDTALAAKGPTPQALAWWRRIVVRRQRARFTASDPPLPTTAITEKRGKAALKALALAKVSGARLSMMDQVYDKLTARALDLHAQLAGEASRLRILIALAGPPGSGKTTIAAEVARRIKNESGVSAAVIPMDGFHYPRAYLDSLPNAAEAHARRGAHWTFDAAGVLQLVQTLHDSRTRQAGLVTAPGFDHATKDPVADAVSIAPEAEIVILEGNWLLFDREPWCRTSALVDDTWFVDVDPVLARRRVAARHIQAGIEETWEAALARVDGNDTLNGEDVRRHLVRPNIMVQSIELLT